MVNEPHILRSTSEQSHHPLLIHGLETNPRPCFGSFNQLQMPQSYPEYSFGHYMTASYKGALPFHLVMS